MEPSSVAPIAPPREIYTVSRLNHEARLLLEGSFPPLWVEGEISNLARPSSGHLYFCLKDAGANIRCALFRPQLRLLGINPKDGMHVVVRARVTLYEGRGEYQLIVEQLEEAGEGALRRAYEALKQRLADEGLFDNARKKPLPSFPKRIGIITSPTGAVLHDILTTLRRRFPAIPVLLYPVPVQGDGAGMRIAEAIKAASMRAECDVLILARGGGSLEDLWAFNEEAVARALANCKIPVVSGVGHETDVTIADFAADVRAPTPTAAAEMVSPDWHAWHEHFRHMESRLLRHAQDALRQRAQRLDWFVARLIHPKARIDHSQQRLHTLTHRLALAKSQRLHRLRTRLHDIESRLAQCSPLARVRRHQLAMEHISGRLRHGIVHYLQHSRQHLAHLGRALNTLSPLATLDRGYAIARDARGNILRDSTHIAVGDVIDTQLARGSLRAVVKERFEK